MARSTMRFRLLVWCVGLCILLAGTASAAESIQLVEAVKQGRIDVVRALIKQKANVNARMLDGATPLLWAAELDSFEIAAVLTAAGADANAANDFGVTPLS